MDFEKNILYGISNKKYLSELLLIDKNKLRSVASHFVVSPFVQEKKGEIRELYNPIWEHKRALKRLVKFLAKLDIPSYITGGVSKRSYVSNVEIHQSNKYAIIIDISDFFPSTDGNKVYNFFRRTLHQSSDIAKILKDLTTVQKDGKCFIPQGYPTSPILSFLAYYKMYEKLAKYAEIHGLSFSTYYDDLTFSSKKAIPKKLKRDIIKIIEFNSLKINKKKSRLTQLDYSKITGCVVLKGELRAPRKLQKEAYDLYTILKKENLYLLPKENIVQLLRRFIGKVSAIQMIEKNRKFPNFEKLISDIKSKL